MDIAFSPRTILERKFEVRVTRAHLAQMIDRETGQRRAAEVRVEHNARRIDHRV